jgi:hypothetical protein
MSSPAATTERRQVAGRRRIGKQNLFPGATPDQLFFYERTIIRNLYRVQDCRTECGTFAYLPAGRQAMMSCSLTLT